MNRSSKKLIGDGKPHERRHPLQGGGVRITTFVPFHFKKRGIKKVIVAPEGVSQPIAVTDTPVLTPEQDRPLLKALGRGIYWQQLIDNGTVASGTEIAERECIHRSTVNDLLRLALLAPDRGYRRVRRAMQHQPQARPGHFAQWRCLGYYGADKVEILQCSVI